MPKIVKAVTGLILFIGIAIGYNNCSEFKSTIQAQSEDTDRTQINDNGEYQNCVIPSLQSSTTNSFRANSVFDQQKLVLAEDNTENYVSLVSSTCLENPELRARSSFTERMALRSGPNDHNLWVKEIARGDLPSDMNSLSDELENDPCVIGLSPSRTYRLNLVREDFDDTFLPQQSHLESLNFFDSLSTFYDPALGLQEEADSVRVRVAVIDTGVFYDHPDLADNIYRGPNGVGVDATTIASGDIVYDGIDVDETVSHGTHVSGIIAARGANGMGLTGLAPRSVQILPINVFYKENPDDAVVITDSATLIRGIQFAISENADVINLSLGGGGDDPALLAALQAAVSSGAFIAASASNEGRELSNDFRTYPAFYAKDIDGMVAVGSINADDKTRSSFSNYSTEYVEIAAPGSELEDGATIQGIASTFTSNNYARLFGTSQSAPMVSAAAALAEALIRQSGGSITPAQMELLLRASAEKNAALSNVFMDGNLLNLQRLAGFINANYPGTGNLAYQAICQTE